MRTPAAPTLFVLLLASSALPQAAPQAPSPTGGEREIRSANGRYLARVRPPADVGFGEVSAKDPVLKSVRWLKVPAEFEGRLTDDGRTLVLLSTKAQAGLPLVQVVRGGSLVLGADPQMLEVQPDDPAGWLSTASPSLRLVAAERDGAKVYRLDLLGRDDRVRTIDLETGEVRPPLAEPDPGPLRVEPHASDESEPAFVGEWFAPEAVFAGEPVPVHVRGSLPTPAWRFSGFFLRADPAGSSRLMLAPRGLIMSGGTISIQVLKGYEETASILGLAPGLYSIAIEDRGAQQSRAPASARSLRVLPARTRVFVGKSGGFAGVEEGVALLEDGRVIRTDRRTPGPVVTLASDAVEASIARILPGLAPAPASRRTDGAADLFEYEIAWTANGRPVRVLRDEKSLEPGLRALVLATEALVAPPTAAVTYVIDPEKSTIEVQTTSGGLLSAFGHDHRLKVRRLTGSVQREPSAADSWSLALSIDSGSLAVIDEGSQSDRAAIEKETNDHVLQVARFPKIEFTAAKVSAGLKEGESRTLDLEGELALHGNTRRIRVPVRLELHGETLHASGKVTLQQTDFGISRPSAVAGTVKVADEVEIRFDVVATAQR